MRCGQRAAWAMGSEQWQWYECERHGALLKLSGAFCSLAAPPAAPVRHPLQTQDPQGIKRSKQRTLVRSAARGTIHLCPLIALAGASGASTVASGGVLGVLGADAAPKACIQPMQRSGARSCAIMRESCAMGRAYGGAGDGTRRTFAQLWDSAVPVPGLSGRGGPTSVRTLKA